MEELLPFLQKYEIWIYILLGVVALIPFQQLISAWRAWQGSVFGLEREIAQRRFTTSLTVLILLVILIFMEFFTVSFIATGYPKAYTAVTPTIDLLATPTFTLPVAAQAITAENSSGNASSGIGLPGLTTQSPDSQATSAATIAGTEPAGATGCIPGQIEWSSPKPGQEISETVELKGTVNVPNLGFYKYEFSKLGEDAWTTIAAGNQPKVDGQIGFWNAGDWDQGDYRLRLVVEDNQGNFFPACVITVRVIKP